MVFSRIRDGVDKSFRHLVTYRQALTPPVVIAALDG
jgi:hypothetical protein